MKVLLHVTTGAAAAPLDSCRSDVHSDMMHTSPTSDVQRASSRRCRGALPFLGGALPMLQHPWLVVVSSSTGAQEAASGSLGATRDSRQGPRTRQMRRGTTFRVAPADSRILSGIVEGADRRSGKPHSRRHRGRSSCLGRPRIFYTARTRPSIEPGWAVVIPLPKIIDASELGGVNWTPRNSSLTATSISKRNPSFS